MKTKKHEKQLSFLNKISNYYKKLSRNQMWQNEILLSQKQILK